MNIDWTIIRRSLEGRLTDDERSLLSRWLGQSPTHKAFYNDVRAHYRKGTGAGIPDHKLKDYRKQFESRLIYGKSPASRRALNRTLRYAAAILLPLALIGGALTLLINNKGQIPPPIEPGIVKAVVYNVDTGLQTILTADAADPLNPDGAPNIENILEARSADGYAGSGQAEQSLKIVVPRGAEYTLTLYDGTVVKLNSCSELTYNANPRARERRVAIEGEGFFDVAPDPARPFIVTASGVEVKVYGTRFNVNTRSGSYVRTVVAEGSVSVSTRTEPEKMLAPNQMGQFDKSTGKIEIHHVNAMHYMGWMSGVYIFENKTIEEIMDELSIWFDVQVEFPSQTARTQRFSGSLPRNRELADLLRLMEKTSRVNFEIKDRTVIVR